MVININREYFAYLLDCGTKMMQLFICVNYSHVLGQATPYHGQIPNIDTDTFYHRKQEV